MIQSLSHTFKAFLLDWSMLPSGGQAAIAIELVKVFFFLGEMSSGINFHGKRIHFQWEGLFFYILFCRRGIGEVDLAIVCGPYVPVDGNKCLPLPKRGNS